MSSVRRLSIATPALRYEAVSVSRTAAGSFLSPRADDNLDLLIGSGFLTQCGGIALWPRRIGSPVIERFRSPISLPPMQRWRARPSRGAEGVFWRVALLRRFMRQGSRNVSW